MDGVGDNGLCQNGFGANGVCANCARDDTDLVSVHRLYLDPDTSDAVGSVTRVAEPELWCSSCRSQYPYEVTRQG